MGTVTVVGKEMIRRVGPALIGLAFVLVVVLALDAADILRGATDQDKGLGGEGQSNELQALANTANELAGWALPVTIAVAPLVCAGSALAMQFGGTRKAVPMIYGSVGAVLVVLLAKGLAA